MPFSNFIVENLKMPRFAGRCANAKVANLRPIALSDIFVTPNCQALIPGAAVKDVNKSKYGIESLGIVSADDAGFAQERPLVENLLTNC